MFAEFVPVYPYEKDDTLAHIFELPTMDSVTTEVSETAVEQLMPVNSDGSVDMEDLRTLARNNITLAKIVEKQGSAYLDVLEKLQKATGRQFMGI